MKKMTSFIKPVKYLSFSIAIVLSIVLRIQSFAQPGLGNLQDEMHGNNKAAESQIFKEYNDQKEEPYVIVQPVHLRLDSIYEYSNFGYYQEIYHWIFDYNGKNVPDTVWRYYYNAHNEFENITEIMTYNSTGQLLKLVRKQPDYYSWQNKYDSIIEIYSEEYMYDNGNLIEKNISSNSFFYTYQSYKVVYIYDAENKLILKITIENNNGYENEYYYNANDELEYDLTAYGNWNSLVKYEYEENDSSKKIVKKGNDFVEKPIFDTVVHWEWIKRYYETYDKRERRTSFMHISDDISKGERINYKQEFNWNEDNTLSHVSYFDWEETTDTGIWKESIRIDNTYDEFGNILLYLKTFYDARTGSWETEHSMTYYYSEFNETPSEKMDENHKKDISDGIYPNPAKSFIYINESFSENTFFTIFSLYGQKIATGKMESNAISVSDLKQGVYLIEIYDGLKLFTGKFLKMK